jgi:type VI secretion system (T6SS) effector TldE1-like protein
MGRTIARADRQSQHRRASWSEAIALVCGAFALAVGAAAWIADPARTALLSADAKAGASSFDERFLPPPPPESLAPHFSSPALARSAFATVDSRILDARELLARQLQSQDWQWALTDETRPSASNSIPLPKARPVEADLAASRTPSPTPQADKVAQGDQRTIFQKLSDLWPGRVTLASLTPGGGLFRSGPDIAALGYDSLTAVYDISARAVYLPGGTTLEAHSGLGGKMDKIEYVGERMVGATPPGAYDLKPREKLFHGVQALRMTPVDSESALGRSGLLVHTYMLGPSGDSNGCVSIRDYERFLKAYNDGEITRLVVVPNLSDSIAASRRSPAPS